MGRQWADKPFSPIATPTDSEAQIAGSPTNTESKTQMALAHNILLRNLNAVYLQAEGVGVSTPQDIADFIIFIQTSYEAIHHHHEIEETYLFPWIEAYTGEKGIMEVNIQQHKAFEADADRFHEYLSDATPETYDGKRLKGIIDGFGAALALHLNAEIETLLGLDKYGGEKLEKAWAMLDRKAMETIDDMNRVLPNALGANDRMFEDGKNGKGLSFPFSVAYLVHYWYARKYRGSWRFSPCTVFGEPKELPFAVEN